MELNFDKLNGLVPCVVQDSETLKVLMLGFMNKEAFSITQEKGLVTFYSRTKEKLWTKGETSGNYLNVIEILPDCDNDTLLIKAKPEGPACHTGSDTCFKENNDFDIKFLAKLETIIKERKENPRETSYTTQLLNSGTAKIAQKVGEEAVEAIIEAMADDKERLVLETSDLVYHLFVLLNNKGVSLKEICKELEKRHA